MYSVIVMLSRTKGQGLRGEATNTNAKQLRYEAQQLTRQGQAAALRTNRTGQGQSTVGTFERWMW